MLLCSKLAELLVNLDPKLHRNYVITSKQGVPILYVKLNKARFGTLCIAVLFYKNIRSNLEEIGFEINPYDPCVANMTINSSQVTFCWHVDDLKVSHKEESAIDAFVLKICKIFVNFTKVSRGKVQYYMVMDMDWSQDGTIIVSMIKYLQKNH